MNDYLSRLAARTLNIGRVVQPRLPNRFETPAALDVQSFEAPPAERVPATIGRPIAAEAESTKPRAHPTPGEHAPSMKPLTPAFHHTTVSNEGSDTDHRERDVAESLADRPLEPRPIVVMASRPSKTSLKTADAAPIPPAVAVPNQADVPERPRETPRTLTTIERENPSTAAKRADGQVPRDLLPAASAPQASAVRTETAATPASVTVRIGRIEVRAVTPAPPLPRRPAPSPPAPALALKDYLNGRRERRR